MGGNSTWNVNKIDFMDFCNMLHDDQKETVWQRPDFHLNIKMFHTFKDHEGSIR
jgi:hypothetical protein